MSTEEVDGATPLHVAAKEGRVDVAESLIAHGADVHARDNIGKTPLDHAVANGNEGVADVLRTRGAGSSPVAP